MLIKYDSLVNATDRWNFTPLHEAAQKGRTQLCSLLIQHGADVQMTNQEGHRPIDLATVSPLFGHAQKERAGERVPSYLWLWCSGYDIVFMAQV